MTSHLPSFWGSTACLTQMSGWPKHDCPHRNTELLLIENTTLSAVQSRNRRDCGAVEDVVLGDLDAVEGECAHCLDQNHHPGDYVGRAVGVQAGDTCPIG